MKISIDFNLANKILSHINYKFYFFFSGFMIKFTYIFNLKYFKFTHFIYCFNVIILIFKYFLLLNQY